LQNINAYELCALRVGWESSPLLLKIYQ